MSLFRIGSQVAGFTLLSRIFGLVRELFIAGIFGVGVVSDSINVAFKLPNLFRRIFAEGALSSVFIPIFNAKLLQSKSNAQNFSAGVFILLIATLIILVGIMQIFMPYLMLLIAPGFYLDEEKFNLSVLLCRITMPYLILISVAAFFGGILNSLSRFAAFAFVPVIFNLVIILACIIKSSLEYMSIIVSISLLVAGFLQVLFMFICLQKAGFTFPIIFKPRDKDIVTLLKNMIPATISAGTIQLNLFISQTLASFLPGAISILAYADRIYQFPLSIIGISFSTILLPELSKMYKSLDVDKAHHLQNKAIKLAFLISLPAASGIWVLSTPIIHVLYERGAFDFNDTIKTAQALSAFAVGLPAFILTKVFTPIFYANLDTKTPLKITLYSIAVNIILNIALMPYFGHVGIALGSSIAAWFNVLLLYVYAKVRVNFYVDSSLVGFCLKVIISCLIMIGFLLIFNGKYSAYYFHPSLLIKALVLSLAIGIGMISFGVSALAMGIKSIIIR